MHKRSFRRSLLLGTLLAMLLAVTPVLAASSSDSVGRTLDPKTHFYVPVPDPGAVKQITQLSRSDQEADADLIRKMVATPQAIWFTQGTSSEIKLNVKLVVDLAAQKNTVPVLVVYNVPGRDCAQYSAGGAATGDVYKAWIDAFVAGLDHRKAVVLVEPDGLALLPTDCGQPDTYDRISLINYAAHALLADPNALVYLDAGNSAWHSVGDMAVRLVQGGVLDVQGFVSNVSNYRFTSYETRVDTWISKCIAFGTDAEEGGWRLGHYTWCASQYFSPLGQVNPDDISTWGYSDQWYDANMGHSVPVVHFVIDTSRNGQGAWTAPSHPAGDAQVWCDPPNRGLGLRPTANTGVVLLDAYLWVKIPGESDGQCYRWTSGPLDPVRNMQDPTAGQWFPQMALELVHNANPPLKQD